MFRMVFKYSYSKETREAKSSQHTWWLGQNPGPGFPYLTFPVSGPRFPNLRLSRVSLALGTSPRPTPRSPLRPLLPESPPFSQQALPQASPAVSGAGRGGGAAVSVPISGLGSHQRPPTHPIPGHCPPFPRPGPLLAVCSRRPLREAHRCDPQTCRPADRRETG